MRPADGLPTICRNRACHRGKTSPLRWPCAGQLSHLRGHWRLQEGRRGEWTVDEESVRFQVPNAFRAGYPPQAHRESADKPGVGDGHTALTPGSRSGIGVASGNRRAAIPRLEREEPAIRPLTTLWLRTIWTPASAGGRCRQPRPVGGTSAGRVAGHGRNRVPQPWAEIRGGGATRLSGLSRTLWATI